MKDGGRSKQSRTAVKKKSYAGCLITKKKKEKKRRRVVESESESSDYSSETSRQKVYKGSAVYKGAYLETKEFETEKRASSGLDVFEFDEYDGFDDIRSMKDANRWSSYRKNGDQMESGNGGLRLGDATSRLEMEDDDFDLPLSALTKKYRSSSNRPIKLQGKNGVLKVMVDKNKQVDVPLPHRSYDQKEPKPKVVHKKKNVENGDDGEGQTSTTMDAKSKEKGGLKSMVEKSSKEVSESDKSNSRVEVKKPENVKKVKEGSGNEKQILREKIKNMLLGGGWTIDYRPRKNKNYLDAIYTNPAGTAYWSIIKAYELLQKEKEEEDSGNFTPLPVEILGKLARQTQKKTERELKTKRKDEGISRNGKRAMEDTDSDDDVELDSHGRKSRKLRRCTLLVRDSSKVLGDNEEDSRKRTILGWLIDSGVVDMSEHVEYMNGRRTRILGKGWITREGIHCGCCSKIQTVMKFEQHSGSKLCNPFPNMFLESGKSLMQCQIDAWSKLGELEQKGIYSVDVDGDDPNDDTCGVCGDGGDLICCDGCPSTFHQSCLEIEMLPEGDWLCPNCSCKYCEMAAAGNCGGETEASLVTCRLCYKKYHESCRPGIDESNSLNLSFCGEKCHEVYVGLQKLVGVKHELDSGFSWSLIHRSDSLTDGEVSQRVECNSMLAVSMSVMDECFLPFTDRRSGINLIRNVVFNCGSNLSRLNYSGFYTAILERGDEVVSAASIRPHGTQLAEMPFIGTRHIYRRQGMCRRLLSAIESALSALQVDKLIIPAVAEHMNTWTDVFGFQPLKESHKQQVKCMNMLVFPGTDMLQKPLLKQPTPNVIPQGNNSVEVDDGSALSKKPELISSNVADLNDKTAITDSCSQEFGVGCSLDASKETLPVKDESPCEPELQLPGMESDSKVDEQNDIGTNHKQVPCGSEMNRKEKETGTRDAFSDSEAANDLTGLHSCNNTTEVDDGSGLSKKSEMVSTNMAEFGDKTTVTDLGAQELGKIHLDDSCSLDAIQEIHPINSPIKDESPCEPERKESDSIHSHSDSKAHLQNDSGTNPLSTHVHDLSHDSIQLSKKESCSSVDVQTEGNNIVIVEVDNGCPLSRDTEVTCSNVADICDKTATSDSSCQNVVHLDAIKETTLPTVEDESPCEPELQLQLPVSGKESDSIHPHSHSKVDDIAVQNGNGTNPFPTRVHDSSHDTIRLSNKESSFSQAQEDDLSNKCELKVGDLNDERDSGCQECDVSNNNDPPKVTCDSNPQKLPSSGSGCGEPELQLQLAGKESVSIQDADANPKGNTTTTIEVDDGSALLSRIKPELINNVNVAEKKGITDSGCQDQEIGDGSCPCLDARKETNSPPVKDVLLSAYKSELVRNSSGGLDRNSRDDDAHFESIQEESTLTEPKLQMPGKESDSYSDSKAAVQNGGSETNPLSTQVHHLSHDVIPSLCRVDMQTADSSMVLEMNAVSDSEAEATNNFSDKSAGATDSGSQESSTCLNDGCSFPINPPGKQESPQLQLPAGKESDSIIHSHSDAHGTDPHPAQLHHDATPFDTHEQVTSTSEPKLQQPRNELDSIHSHSDEIAMENSGNENADKDNIQFLEGKQGSSESELNKGGVSDSEAGSNLNGQHSNVCSNAEDPCTEERA